MEAVTRSLMPSRIRPMPKIIMTILAAPKGLTIRRMPTRMGSTVEIRAGTREPLRS